MNPNPSSPSLIQKLTRATRKIRSINPTTFFTRNSLKPQKPKSSPISTDFNYFNSTPAKPSKVRPLARTFASRAAQSREAKRADPPRECSTRRAASGKIRTRRVRRGGPRFARRAEAVCVAAAGPGHVVRTRGRCARVRLQLSPGRAMWRACGARLSPPIRPRTCAGVRDACKGAWRCFFRGATSRDSLG